MTQFEKALLFILVRLGYVIYWCARARSETYTDRASADFDTALAHLHDAEEARDNALS